MAGTAHRAAIAALALFVASPAACGDDDTDTDVDVTAACDRLEDLANAVLDVHEATTAQEVRDAVAGPLDAFVDAARGSGDDQLEDLANTAAEAYPSYLAGDDHAGETADVAIDMAAKRCIDLGATNDFPEEP